jgi:thiol:disulfide interchange protein DsbD
LARSAITGENVHVKARFPAMAAASAILFALLFHPTLAHAGPQSGGDFSNALASGGVLLALGTCFVAGLAMSMTPCVWPMIPITVSIFGASEAKSRARAAALSGTFVLGLATFFAIVGIAVALAGHAIGGFLGKWYVATGIALLLAVLASSMFGAFEIALPASLQNKLSSVGGIGFKGAYVLGLVMALVAAPCTTGFIAGLMIEVAQRGNVVLGAASFAMLAIGMGVPFFIAGGLAMSLPKPGAWMLGIKYVAGVVLAYMALSYLGDGFPALKKKVVSPAMYYAAIGVVLAVIGLVLSGIHIASERRKSTFKHLSKPTKLGSLVPAIVGSFMVVSWILIPRAEEPAIAANTPAGSNGASAPAPPITWDDKDGIAALAKANADHKPVIIDFGAEWCKACKELEEKTFPDPRVRAEAARFAGIHVDMTDDEAPNAVAMGSKCNVNGALLPALLLLDANGKEVQRFNGFIGPEDLVTSMHTVQ